jgi:hypothetical protein
MVSPTSREERGLATEIRDGGMVLGTLVPSDPSARFWQRVPARQAPLLAQVITPWLLELCGSAEEAAMKRADSSGRESFILLEL